MARERGTQLWDAVDHDQFCGGGDVGHDEHRRHATDAQEATYRGRLLEKRLLDSHVP